MPASLFQDVTPLARELTWYESHVRKKEGIRICETLPYGYRLPKSEERRHHNGRLELTLVTEELHRYH
jgi:hypothetical protein